jgi:hypothetical protein
VFPDRYHERVLASPRQCRNAICYVLNNFRRHGEDRVGPARQWKLDPHGLVGTREVPGPADRV